MEKDEVTSFLRKKGYDAVNDRGVVMIKLPVYSKSAEKAIRELFKEVGYSSSFGIVTSKDALNLQEDTDVSPDEEALEETASVDVAEVVEEAVAKKQDMEAVTEPVQEVIADETDDYDEEEEDYEEESFIIQDSEQLTFEW